MFLTEEANVISNFLHGGRLMDVFWNDPLLNNIPHHLSFSKTELAAMQAIEYCASIDRYQSICAKRHMNLLY